MSWISSGTQPPPLFSALVTIAFMSASVVVVSSAIVVRIEYGSSGGTVSEHAWLASHWSWIRCVAPL